MRALRRLSLRGIALVAATGLSAAAPASDPSDMALGSPKAPVTIIEYASLGCPHCAKLNNDVFPAFKKKYIDTGKVRWVAREMITGDPYLATAGFIVARCSGPTHYFQVTDAVYHNQGFLSTNLHDGLLKIAEEAGMTEAQFDACINDKKGSQALDARVKLAGEDGIDSTPTLMVRGKIVSDSEVDMAKLDKIVADALANKGKAAPSHKSKKK